MEPNPFPNEESWLPPEDDREPPPDEKSKAGPVVPYDPLQRYLREINRYPLLTPEEEKELLLRYQKNQDSEVAYRLITSNLRLVV